MCYLTVTLQRKVVTWPLIFRWNRLRCWSGFPTIAMGWNLNPGLLTPVLMSITLHVVVDSGWVVLVFSCQGSGSVLREFELIMVKMVRSSNLTIWKHFDGRGRYRVCIIQGQVRGIWMGNCSDDLSISDESNKWRLKIQ